MLTSEQPLFEFRGPWGIPVQIGGSIALLFIIFLPLGGSSEMMILGLIQLAVLIFSIFLHELGHAWGCLIQDVRVNRIMLYGGGGFCEHSMASSRYEDELIVAMGPIVNLAVWALSSLSLGLIADPYLYTVVQTLAVFNLFLALFNLLPLMPLDGGKLFYLVLMRFLPPLFATRLCGWVGVVATVLWIPAMVWVFFTLGFVLFFFPSLGLHWRMATSQRA